MSSIRPLATITVLALVGVFLYLKINETEPPLPEGVEDWAANTDVQFEMDGTDPGASPYFESPSFERSSAGKEAPPFSMDSASVSASVSASLAPAPGASAPTFDPGAAPPALPNSPVNNALPATVGSASSFESVKSDVSTVATPEFPDFPTLPPAPSTAPSVDVASQNVGALPAKPQALVPHSNGAVTNGAVTNGAAGSVAPQANTAARAQSSLFSATRLAVQAALDRGELSQALLLLSDWYGDPSLSLSEATEVNTLLGQLAGSVIYSTEHRLEPPYMVQAGERIETIAKKYDVPWQLLAKINGIISADQLQPGQELKVIRGPFSAVVDISARRMTLMLDRRYAGRFTLNVDPSVTVEAGHWEVNQKLLTPANASLQGTGPTTPTEERSLMLSNTIGGASQVAILRGATTSNPLAEPVDRVLRMNSTDAEDVFDILSLGSKVVIRR